jgi:hypothetical protein
MGEHPFSTVFTVFGRLTVFRSIELFDMTRSCVGHGRIYALATGHLFWTLAPAKIRDFSHSNRVPLPIARVARPSIWAHLSDRTLQMLENRTCPRQ